MFIFQLAYISFKSNHFSDTEENLLEILETAKAHNESIGVTGMLLYKGGVFLQLLEGDRDSVLNLYGKIATDLRHEGLKVVVKQNSSERVYKNWSMGYKHMQDIDIDDIKEILPWDKLLEETRNHNLVPQEKIVEIFKKFRFKL